MRWVLYLFGSGLCFFIGAACVLAAMGVYAIGHRIWHLRSANGLALFGILLVAMSAAPLPYWFYGALAAVTLPLIVAEQYQTVRYPRWRIWWRAIAAVSWSLGIGLELIHQVPPTVSRQPTPDFYIVADSVTAGTGEREIITWPKLLEQAHPTVKVHDFSRMGATVKSAYGQAERLPATGGLVLLEIGGNDLLGTTTLADFEQHLERLLDRVRAPDRTVLMFELPLPPLCNPYGIVQRRLAAKYSVKLVPKRLLMGVLTGSEATLDSVHLSQAGHQHMASVIWGLIRTAYE